MTRHIIRTIALLGAVAATVSSSRLDAQNKNVALDRSVVPTAGATPELHVPSWSKQTLGNGARLVVSERHALPLVEMIKPHLEREGWQIAPCCLVAQGRVAIGDEIGALLPTHMTVMLIGERPGLSSPDSLGAYLTWNPLPGRSNAERNCVSNIRPQGLSYAAAAFKILHLMRASRAGKVSGIALKDNALLPDAAELVRLFPGSDAS